MIEETKKKKKKRRNEVNEHEKISMHCQDPSDVVIRQEIEKKMMNTYREEENAITVELLFVNHDRNY